MTERPNPPPQRLGYRWDNLKRAHLNIPARLKPPTHELQQLWKHLGAVARQNAFDAPVRNQPDQRSGQVDGLGDPR